MVQAMCGICTLPETRCYHWPATTTSARLIPICSTQCWPAESPNMPLLQRI